MMTVRDIRGWLLCQPHPSSLRILGADDAEHKFAIENGSSWVRVAESVHALQPVLLEALNAKGELIRATRPNEVDEEEEEQTESFAVSDPESQRLIVFAKLLADAYKHSNDVAFDKLASLFDATNKRAESLEKTVQAVMRMREKQIIDGAAEVDAEGPLTLQDLLMGFLQGQQQAKIEGAAKAAATAAGKEHANGAAKEPDA